MIEDGKIKGLMGIYDNGETDISLKDKQMRSSLSMKLFGSSPK